MRAFIPPPRPGEIDLFLDSNEGPTPPSPVTLQEWLSNIEPRELRSYPDSTSFQRLWAHQLGVHPDQLFVTAGGDDATDRICRAFLCPGREAILPVPTFEMLGHYARLTGAAVHQVAWPPGSPYPLREVMARITPQTALIAVISPNNPTGTVAEADDLKALAAAAPHALILLDQAYIEFADPSLDLLSAALALPNVVAIRTMSKAMGLAGLRIGCAIGSADVLSAMRIAGPVFPAAAPSLAIASAALSRRAGQRDGSTYLARIKRERDHLVQLLSMCPGVESWPSHANFILAKFKQDADGSGGAAAVHRALWQRGISVRQLKPIWQAWSLDQCIRITCPGDLAAFQRLTGALLDTLWRPGIARRIA